MKTKNNSLPYAILLSVISVLLLTVYTFMNNASSITTVNASDSQTEVSFAEAE